MGINVGGMVLGVEPSRLVNVLGRLYDMNHENCVGETIGELVISSKEMLPNKIHKIGVDKKTLLLSLGYVIGQQDEYYKILSKNMDIMIFCQGDTTGVEMLKFFHKGEMIRSYISFNGNIEENIGGKLEWEKESNEIMDTVGVYMGLHLMSEELLNRYFVTYEIPFE